MNLLFLILAVLTGQAEVISYSCGRMTYDWNLKKIILTDSAYVEYGDIKLYGDTIIYYPDEKVVEVIGNMKILQKEQELAGERMVFNIDTKYGIVDGGKTAITEGFFTGDTVWQIQSDLWYVTKGTFTTCEDDPPHYHFWGNAMIIEQNGMLIAEPVILYIGNVPVFALPWWFFPIKRGRYSGFLFPNVGNSSTDGRYVKNVAYFWAINDYSDMTFSVDIMEKRGVRFNAAGMYIVKPFLSGNFGLGYIRETNTGIERWRIEGNHFHQINSSTRMLARADWQSDKRYRIDYGTDVLVDLNKRTSSYFSVSKNWSFLSGQALLLRSEDLIAERVSYSLPEISYTLFSRRILAAANVLNLYFSNSGRFNRGIQNDSTGSLETDQMSMNAGLQNPIKVLGFFNFNPGLSMSGTVKKYDTANVYFYSRSWSTSMTLSTFIYGLTNWSAGSLQRIRHVLNPSVSYVYSPGTVYGSFGDTSYEYSSDAKVSKLNLNLSQSLQLKWQNGENISRFELFSLGASTSYDFEKSVKNFSDISLSFDSRFSNKFSISCRWVYDPYTLERISSSYYLTSFLSGNIGKKYYYSDVDRQWSLTTSYSMTQDRLSKNQQVWFTAGIHPTDNWKVTYSARWDIEKNNMVNQSLSVYRDLHCWEAFFSWQKFNEAWSYSFTIRIKSIQDVRVMRSMVSFFVPRI
ncbi:LPS-assembly protein LptD [candidate division WOR-3 bacterium]|nr:LPS-assembly protein LptD [candidate division WOR-3 bacterium]